MIAFDVRRTQPKLNARSLGRKNLDFWLVQLPEIRHSFHRQGARPSKRIRMCANVFSFTSSFAHFLSINQSINKLDLSKVVNKAEKLMWLSQKKKKYKTTIIIIVQ